MKLRLLILPMLLLSASSYSSNSDSGSYTSSSSAISTSTCSTCAHHNLNKYMDHLESNGWGRRNSKTYKLKYRYARRFFSNDPLRKTKLQTHEENLRSHGKRCGISKEEIDASINLFKKEVDLVDRGITPPCLLKQRS